MTFTKLFSSITESSIWSQDDATRLVWITMLAMADRHGRVWASVPGLANRARVSISACEKALECFLSPDQYSRTKDYDGVRIEPIDGGWMLLNHKKYRDIRDEVARKEQNAAAQDRFRRKQNIINNADSKPEVSQGKPTRKPIADADADADTSIKKDGACAPVRSIFKKPELPELKLAMAKIGIPEDQAVHFLNHYESNGWKVGKNPMRSWPHAVGNWATRYREKAFQKPTIKPPAPNGY